MNEVVKELLPYLQAIADKLESSANALWQLQMAQAKVAMISMMLEYIALATTLYLARKVFLWFIQWRKENDNEGVDIFAMIFGVIASIVITGWFIGCIVSVKTFVTLIVNPEYWALHELLRMVK